MNQNADMTEPPPFRFSLGNVSATLLFVSFAVYGVIFGIKYNFPWFIYGSLVYLVVGLWASLRAKDRNWPWIAARSLLYTVVLYLLFNWWLAIIVGRWLRALLAGK